MLNIYTLEVRSVCPVNKGETDLYSVTVTSNLVIQVERIIQFFEKFSTTQIFQEELTRRAATALGARVETVGIHSGVTVRSIAP